MSSIHHDIPIFISNVYTYQMLFVCIYIPILRLILLVVSIRDDTEVGLVGKFMIRCIRQ